MAAADDLFHGVTLAETGTLLSSERKRLPDGRHYCRLHIQPTMGDRQWLAYFGEPSPDCPPGARIRYAVAFDSRGRPYVAGYVVAQQAAMGKSTQPLDTPRLSAYDAPDHVSPAALEHGSGGPPGGDDDAIGHLFSLANAILLASIESGEFAPSPRAAWRAIGCALTLQNASALERDELERLARQLGVYSPIADPCEEEPAP